MNAVRSPMAAGCSSSCSARSIYVGSAGVQKGRARSLRGRRDGRNRHRHLAPQAATFEELEDLEGLNFDLIVTLSPPAHHKALELTRIHAAEVEYWPTLDPTGVEGSREQRLDAYRAVRDELMAQHPRALRPAGRRQRMRL